MSRELITFRVFRYRAGQPESERFDEIELPVAQSTTVLEVLEHLRRSDPTLMYRRSCHHGSCGTCACLINGRERLACTTRVLDLDSRIVTIEPLRKLTRLGDLVVEPADFFREYPADWRTLRSSEANPDAATPEELSGYTRLENCIECGACVSACPVEGFLGPAVLAGLNRELLNSHGEEAADRENPPDHEKNLLEMAGGDRGVWKCRRALECSRVCPTGVYPARHIADLRRRLSDHP